MIIKAVIDYKRLAALHEFLKSPDNHWEGNEWHYGKTLVSIKSVKGVVEEERRTVPPYEVVLVVEEHLYEREKEALVPLSKLRLVLAAMGLFPEDNGVPRAG